MHFLVIPTQSNCCGVTPASNYAPPSWLVTNSSGTGERIGKVKVEKIMGWDKDRLLGKGKPAHRRKAKQGICSGVQPYPGQPGSIMCNGYLGRQMSSLWMPPSSFFPQLYMLSVTAYGMEYLFGLSGSAVPAVSAPNYCIPSLLAGARSRKGLDSV